MKDSNITKLEKILGPIKESYMVKRKREEMRQQGFKVADATWRFKAAKFSDDYFNGLVSAHAPFH